MKIRNFLTPAVIVMMSSGLPALAQSQAPAPAAVEPEGPQAVEPQQAVQPQQPAEPASVNTEAAGGAKPAAVAPRTAEQAAVAREIARKAPKRRWAELPSSPARDETLMYEITGKKVSDVAIIASVDQVNKLELLDITGRDTSDTLRVPTAGGRMGAALADGGEEAPATGAAAESDAAAPPALSETAPEAKGTREPASETIEAGSQQPQN